MKPTAVFWYVPPSHGEVLGHFAEFRPPPNDFLVWAPKGVPHEASPQKWHVLKMDPIVFSPQWMARSSYGVA